MAHKRPRPPSRAGRKARRRASGQAAPRSPRSACSVPQTAWSCASAYAADWEGGTVRSKCCARGAAQKRSGSQAHCKSGSCGSSASKPCSCSRRSLAHAATYSGAPMGVPRSGNGLSPRHASGPSSEMPGRAAPPARLCRRAFCLGWRQPRQVPQRQKKPLRARRARDWAR